ncbi:MAG: divergent polysaccharide deacetylase family protein [Defluviicoccus sp.]
MGSLRALRWSTIVRGLRALGAALGPLMSGHLKGGGLARPAVVAAGLGGAGALLLFVLAAVFLRTTDVASLPAVDVALPAGGSGDPSPVPEPMADEAAADEFRVAAVAAEAYRDIARAPAAEPLAAAPDPALIESRGALRLPRIGVDGRLPYEVYARPFDRRDDRPRLSIIILGFGLSATASRAVLDHLPAEMTLALDAYAAEPGRWLAAARAAGHEVFAALPIQAVDAERIDAGPRALVPGGASDDSLARLDQILGRCTGCVGVIALGGEDVAEFEPLLPALRAVQQRGLMFVDATLARERPLVPIADRIGLPRGWLDMRIDADPSAAAIDARLQRLEEVALKTGVGVAAAGSSPLAVRRLALWAETLAARNLVLAPVSAAVASQLVAGATR